MNFEFVMLAKITYSEKNLLIELQNPFHPILLRLTG
jgi:hypothetical protein